VPTPELVRIVVRMKLRLGFKTATRQETIFTALLLLAGLGGVIAGLVGIWSQFGEPDRGTRAMLALAALSIGWLFVTIVFGGGEGTLDPARFALFPITDRQLVAGLFVAAFLGAPAAATAVVSLATASYATSAFGAIVMVLSAVLVTVTAVLSGRVGITSMSGMLRGRRTREIAGGIAALFGMSIGLVGTLLGEFSEFLTADRLAAAREVVRFLPWAWAPEAAGLAEEGRVGLAFLFLAGAVGFAGLLLWAWWRMTATLLTTRAISNESAVGNGLVPRWMTVFGRSPVIGVWARSLRQLRRDPREFLEVAGFLPMMVIFAIPNFDAIQAGNQQVVLSSASLGVAIGITSLNMFGADGRSFGVDALAVGNITPVLIGKALARISMGVPLIGLMAFGLAVATGGWAYIAPSLLIGLTGLLSMTAVGMFVSTRFPFPLPEKAMLGGQGADGCATGLIRMVALVSAMLISLPGVAATALATVWWSPLIGTAVGLASLVYGLGLFWFSATRSGRWATHQIPRIFQQLAAKT
jgi:ABC-2 type transport system permease protein